MRNFCSPVKHNLAIDLSLSGDKLILQKKACLDVLSAAMQSYIDVTPSEQFSMDSFEMWYKKVVSDFQSDEGFGGTADSWLYVNLNTGAIVIFTTFFNEGDGWEPVINTDWLDEELPGEILEDLRSAVHSFQ